MCLISGAAAPLPITYTVGENTKSSDSIQLHNLYVFARMYGYIRFFHPSTLSLKADWDYVLYSGIRAVKSATTDSDLVESLKHIFLPIAPAMCFYTDTPDSVTLINETIKKNDGQRYRYWLHRGYGWNSYSPLQKALLVPYRSSLHRVSSKGYINSGRQRAKDNVFRINIDGVNLYMPIAVAIKHAKPDKTCDYFKHHEISNSIADPDIRISDIIMCWNILRHFYPYWDAIHTDWNNVLKTALTKSSSDTTASQFLETFKKLGKPTDDGHGNYSIRKTRGFSETAIDAEWVEGKLVVTKSINETGIGIHPGDIILKINQKDVSKLMSEKTPLECGSQIHSEFNAIENLMSGFKDSVSTFELMDKSGAHYTKALPHIYNTAHPKPWWSLKPLPIRQVDSHIYYLKNPSRGDFKKLTQKTDSVQGLIVDFRDYPGYMLKALGHLSKTTLSSPTFLYPKIIFPYEMNQVSYDTLIWHIRPKKPFINTKVVFLIDGATISMGESYSLIIRSYNLGTIIGSNSAGITGDMNYVNLRGDCYFTFTGCRVMDQNGHLYFKNGIDPDIRVDQTIKALQTGNDALIEKAIEVIKNR